MSNIRRDWCPCCKQHTDFYNVEVGVWECDDCGYEIDEDEGEDD